MREVTEYLVTVRYNEGGNEGLVLRTIGAISPIRMVYEVTTSNLEKEIQVSCYCSSKEKLDELEQELRATGVVNSVSIRRL